MNLLGVSSAGPFQFFSTRRLPSVRSSVALADRERPVTLQQAGLPLALTHFCQLNRDRHFRQKSWGKWGLAPAPLMGACPHGLRKGLAPRFVVPVAVPTPKARSERGGE